MSRQRYSRDFQIEAVKLVPERGLSRAEVVRRLGGTATSLREWIKRLGPETDGEGRAGEASEELRRLREANRQLRMEREILKKATAFFAEEQR
jgi:transposase